MITNSASGTNVHEIAADIYRINTTVAIPGTPGFSFNQYLVVDDAPFLFHTGLRGLFPVVSEAIAAVMPVSQLQYLALSHFEADECGAINEFLAVAPNAVPVCGRIAAMTSVNDFALRPPRVLADEEDLDLGHHRIRWFDTPHVPHAWECGLAMDMTTRTFFCGDLFTQGGDGAVALTETDILGPSEAFRKPLDYFAHAPQTRVVLDALARYEPMTMAVMHGSAWRGNGAQLLRGLRDALSA
jgi:flavorubredoxin